jgi:shikimate kinase
MTVNNQIIYIIGFMGSGKTTAGKKLASLLDWKFIDLDNKIEEYTGKTIPEIFSGDGEEYFRDIETQLLRNLKSQTNTIVSTGGGTPCHSNNMDFMISTGLTIYLKLTPGELKSRLSGSESGRPLIKDLEPLALQIFIEKKLAERERWYDRSDITLEGMDMDISSFLDSIKDRLNNIT